MLDIPDQRRNAEMAAGQYFQGQLQIASALASLYSDPAPQQAVIEGARQNAAMGAEAIRNRYYQKEFEMVRNTRLKPIMQSMQSDLEELRAKMAIATRPVMRTVNAVQGQELGETLQGQDPSIIEAPTGKAGKDGKPAPGKPMMMPAPPAPNPAMQPGKLGATETYDALSIMDPSTGMPVDVDDPRFRAIVDEHTRNYWDRYNQHVLDIMDIFGEYPGNPLADKAQEQIMKWVEQQAGFAATAETNPDKQAAVMQQREKANADIANQRAKTEELQLLNQSRMGGLEGGASFLKPGGEYAGRPEVMSLLGDQDKQRLAQGQELDPRTAARLSGISSGVLERDKLAAQRSDQLLRSGVIAIPPAIENVPENWYGHLASNDARTKGLFTQHVQQQASTVIQRLANMSPDARIAQLQQVGATPKALRAAAQGMWSDPDLGPFLEQIALADPNIVRDSQAFALQQRLPEVARVQPNVSANIDAVVDDYIDQLHQQGYDLSPEDEDLLRADRYRVFTQHTMGYDAPAYRSHSSEADYQQALDRLNRRRDVEAALRRDEQAAAAGQQRAADVERLAGLAPPEEGGSYTPILSTPPAPGQEITFSPTNEEAPPAEEQMSETERVYGVDASPRRLIQGIGSLLGAQPLERQKTLNIAPTLQYGRSQATPLGVAETNPYIGQPPEVLMEILTSLPRTAESQPVVDMIKAALEAGE